MFTNTYEKMEFLTNIKNHVGCLKTVSINDIEN